MPAKEFLEDYALYRTYHGNFEGLIRELAAPPINYWCDRCSSAQTFNLRHPWQTAANSQAANVSGSILRGDYSCSACKYFTITFLIQFSRDSKEVKKVGQSPPWSIKMDQALATMLGKHAMYYQRGLICESQSYGIGAYAYYRRIVEEIIDELVNDIAEMVEPNDKSAYADALAEAKKTHVAKDKIAVVKDLLPGSLRPDNMNPLAVLHTALSEGLHGRSDEECLEDAVLIRKVLVFLVRQITQAKREGIEFTNSLKKILDKKSKRAE